MEKIRVIRVGSPKHEHAKKADLIKKKVKTSGGFEDCATQGGKYLQYPCL